MSADDNWGTFKFTRRFATVSGLNDMFQAVCNRIWETFSLVWCETNISPISSNMKITRAVLKRPLAQCVQAKSFTNVSAAATIEDIRRHVYHESFIETYQHDDEFVSKCN